jgi:catechol 1,2-dioxygenase
MKRRAFIRDATLSLVAVSTSGFIRFNGDHYIGNCETTTDILGPFYRPGSPIRKNLVIQGVEGSIVELGGVVKHNDCKTPYPKAKIELWHCSPEGKYDNSSDEYQYRGTSYTDENGKYSFKTLLPVPYPDPTGAIRPAHFHLMITTGEYQPFITQLYFTGDEYIPKDPYSASPNSKRRILDIQTLKDGTKRVFYDISMSPRLSAEPAVIDKLTGVYVDEKNLNNKMEFFKKNNMLWKKNEVFGREFLYIGNNTFEYPNQPLPMSWTFHFEILPQGAIKVTETDINEKGQKQVNVAVKVKE